MLRPQRTPLAWSLLTHDKKRLFLSVAGVAFAVFLMFIEMGFLNGVYDSQTLLMRHLNADLVMLQRLKDSFHPIKPFSRRRLLQALKFDGVQAVYPVYVGNPGLWKGQNKRVDFICVVGINPSDPALLLPEIAAYRDVLRRPNTALADDRSRDLFGPLRPGAVAELNGRKVRLGGTFSLGPDFVVDGRLIMSDFNFVTYFPDRKTGMPNFDCIELGLIKVAPGVDAEQLRQRIQASLPQDTRILTKDALVEEEERFWATSQPVGLIFGVGMIVGFLIGVSICNQILFTDVNDHLAEFATLKAIGYPNRFLMGVVLREALCLSLVAFLPGLVFSFLLYSRLEEMTGIMMRLTTTRVAIVFLLTVAMCLVAGAFAVRKVLSSDPAEVF